MKQTKIVLLAIFLQSAMPSFVNAQDAGTEWIALNQKAKDLSQAREYSSAIVVAQKALQVAEQNVGPDHPDVAVSLNSLGVLYGISGDYQKPVALFQRALAIREKAFGPQHPYVADSLNHLAGI